MDVIQELERKARELYRLIDEQDHAEAKLKAVKENIDLLQLEFVALMKDNGILKKNVEGVGEIYLYTFLRASIPDAVKEATYQNLKQIGEGNLIKTVESIHHKTLSGYVNGLLKDGKPIPAGIEYNFVESVKIK